MNCLEWENTGCGRKNGCFECEKKSECDLFDGRCGDHTGENYKECIEGIKNE